MVRVVCSRMLALGNALNWRNQALRDAKGFALEGLLQLSTFHVTSSGPRAAQGLSLLHYLAAHLLTGLPMLDGEWPNRQMARSAAARAYMAHVRGSLETLLALPIDKIDMADLAEQVEELCAQMTDLIAEFGTTAADDVDYSSEVDGEEGEAVLTAEAAEEEAAEAAATATDYPSDDREACKACKVQGDRLWDASFRRALADVCTSKAPSRNGLPGPLDGRWTAESLRVAMDALRKELEGADSALVQVSAAFGGRFTAGYEERIEAVAHIRAVQRFVPQLELALQTVQHTPALLRLAAIDDTVSDPQSQWMIAGSQVTRDTVGAPSNAPSKGSTHTRKARSVTMAIVDAWNPAANKGD